ncbi:hypothetical protein GCM10023195_81450 [Actinoallomurus liliacearum]|uniref:Uncharacterized protein n=1 Tax=Actinoallomurus liliacearum TaxID=1080073 RepID=A0ABP8U0H1_9ACTN
MSRIGSPVRALMRLDDRVLGARLYYRPLPPLRVDIARTVAAATLVSLFAALTGNLFFLVLPAPAIAAVWYRRARHNRRSG